MLLIDSIAFYLLGATALMSALFAIGVRNIVHSIIAFATLLISIAGLFGLLGAPFIAIGQLVIFVGGLISLLLFGVMFNKEEGASMDDMSALQTLSDFGAIRAAASIAFSGVIVYAIFSYIPAVHSITAPTFTDFSSALFSEYWEAMILGFVALFIAIVTATFLLEDEKEPS